MKIKHSTLFLIVYSTVSIATFYHSAWGFGTLSGYEPEGWLAWALWWLLGALMAAAVDIGIGVIVYSLATGWKAPGFIKPSLWVLACTSGFTQLIYAAHHAADYRIGAVADWLAFLQYALDARIVLLPIALPAFALIYAFAAKAPDSDSPLWGAFESESDLLEQSHAIAESEPEIAPEGIEQTQDAPEIALSEIESESEIAESESDANICLGCEREFETVQALSAHKRWCEGLKVKMNGKAK